MGRVSIWAQWSIIGAGVLLCPLLVLFMAAVIGRLLISQLLQLRQRDTIP